MGCSASSPSDPSLSPEEREAAKKAAKKAAAAAAEEKSYAAAVSAARSIDLKFTPTSTHSRVKPNDPKRCHWKEAQGFELEPLLAYTTLVDVRWLLAYARGKSVCKDVHGADLPRGVIPAWQQLPKEAVVEVEKLRYSSFREMMMPVGVLSYGWASRAHPDPTGEQHGHTQCTTHTYPTPPSAHC